ncbi:hypothetical protein NIES4071_45850 [Calothrix sp. NIES-4071]|nr:hypothetical protein NIES4071_45850 [Calothrix sp. NIES-4071]BAZ58897.1 hypothetical protein NIES4105_45780 [Calothrix sp. NIES-4105]
MHPARLDVDWIVIFLIIGKMVLLAVELCVVVIITLRSD